MLQWSPQQETAIKGTADWLKSRGQQVYKIMGYAGTGKTTLAKEIAAQCDGDVLYGAFTGKAASVMRRKGCAEASTIHGMIYKVKEDDESDQPTFVLNRDSDVRRAKLVIIDEVSMVNEELGRDLLSFGTKVLVLGDPGQLPPIKGTGYFIDGTPDQMLTEVHRQARDNPIIQMSMMIREGNKLPPGVYGDSKVIDVNAVDQAEVLAADQVLVGLNRTRNSYNKRLRELLERPADRPVKGDKLICLRNDRTKGIYNGTMWEAANIKKDNKGRPIYHMLLNALDEPEVKKKGVQVRREFFEGTDANLEWQDKRGTQEFTYGYAITCHKSQGSQWDNIFIFNEASSFREDAKRWLYTAVTRAAVKLTMVA